jgi:hypothetical protein
MEQTIIKEIFKNNNYKTNISQPSKNPKKT